MVKMKRVEVGRRVYECVCVCVLGRGLSIFFFPFTCVTQATSVIRGILSKLVSFGSEVCALTKQQRTMTDDHVSNRSRKTLIMCWLRTKGQDCLLGKQGKMFIILQVYNLLFTPTCSTQSADSVMQGKEQDITLGHLPAKSQAM